MNSLPISKLPIVDLIRAARSNLTFGCSENRLRNLEVKLMNRLLTLFAVLIVSTSFAQSDNTKNQNGIFQALKQTEGGFNLGNWDGSRILSPKGEVLTVVSIKEGRLDFSRAAGQTRTALLKSLYEAGLRIVHISMEQFLTVSPEGHLLARAAQNVPMQVLKESDDGFDLDTTAHKTTPSQSGANETQQKKTPWLVEVASVEKIKPGTENEPRVNPGETILKVGIKFQYSGPDGDVTAPVAKITDGISKEYIMLGNLQGTGGFDCFEWIISASHAVFNEKPKSLASTTIARCKDAVFYYYFLLPEKSKEPLALVFGDAKPLRLVVK